MGLTTRKHQEQLVPREPPHYYEVKIPNHPNGVKQMHIGQWKDVEPVLERYPDATVNKVYPPGAPDTVDVPYITIEDQRLPMQQILPESRAIKLEL